MRILLADDDPTVRSLLTLRLSAEDHDVTAVEDGDQVLLALAAETLGALVPTGPAGSAPSDGVSRAR